MDDIIFNALADQLKCLDEYEREALFKKLFSIFCRHCYIELNGKECHCWNDE